MATINRFEDLLAWQKASELSTLLVQITDRKAWNRDWDLREQIRSSSNSVAGNIAEGFGKHSDKEFRRFLRIAKGSASETRSHAYKAAQIAGCLTADELARVCSLSEECERLIQGLINYLTQSITKAESSNSNPDS